MDKYSKAIAAFVGTVIVVFPALAILNNPLAQAIGAVAAGLAVAGGVFFAPANATPATPAPPSPPAAK